MRTFFRILWNLFLSLLVFLVIYLPSVSLIDNLRFNNQPLPVDVSSDLVLICFLLALSASVCLFIRLLLSLKLTKKEKEEPVPASVPPHTEQSPYSHFSSLPNDKLMQFIHKAQWYAATDDEETESQISPEDQAVIDNFSAAIDAMLSAPPKEPLTKEEYQSIRQAERDWLEEHYDFSTVESVNAIPEIKDLPRPPGDGVTGDVYYHLHYKARLYADDLKYDIAIACQKKSNALIKFRYGNWSGRRECYYLVKLYARAGLIEEAYSEKEKIERFYGVPNVGTRDYIYAQDMIQLAIKQGKDEQDFHWLQTNLPTLCPKSKNGFCRMRSQNTKNYQTLKAKAAELGKEI